MIEPVKTYKAGPRPGALTALQQRQKGDAVPHHEEAYHVIRAESATAQEASRRDGPRPSPGPQARRIYFESLVLEDRTLLASLSTVLNAYDSATAGIGVLNQFGAQPS